MIDSDNDGVRTHVVKLLEGLTLILSKKTAVSLLLNIFVDWILFKHNYHIKAQEQQCYRKQADQFMRGC